MKHEVRVETHTVEETKALGRWIGKHASNDVFLALAGDLGTGKTHFVQGLAEGLSVEGPVTSPTFNIMNVYEGDLELKHFDFYRLESADDLYNIGWDEYSVGGVVVAEWADMFPQVVPPEAVWITLKRTSENDRLLIISWDDSAPKEITKEIETYALSH